MAARTHFSADDARRVGAEIGIDWDSAPFDLEQFRSGMDVELEHGRHDPVTKVTDDDPVVTGTHRNGLGGVPNPQSPDKAIPALSGADFFKEFNTDEKVIDVIRSGSVIGRAPIVSMPHWGGIILDSHPRPLVAYIKTLKTG
jgi:hypothetical protein